MSHSAVPPACRRLPVVLRLLPVLLAAAWPFVARGVEFEFDLPAQPAARALLAFSQQAKVEVLFSFDELSRVQASAVRGRLEPAAALEQLLRGTGFAARRNWNGKFVVAAAQPTGSIRGRLLSPLGGAVAGIRVTLPALRRAVVTNESGDFAFTEVPAGSYLIAAGGEGYRALEITDVAVREGQAVTLEPLTLQQTDSLVRLDPFVVETRSGPADRRTTLPLTRIAAGDLDLPRSENGALPYQVYERERILRSGEVNLNEYLQRELLESDASKLPPEQDANPVGFVAGSSNLNLRGFGADETVVLVNGRRLPEVLTATGGMQPPDVNLVPLGLVQRIEVLPISASALYSGNPVGGVINVILRKNVVDTEVTATYSNAARGFNAPQSSLVLQHGQSLLDGRLHLLLNATFTQVAPPTESQLDYHHGVVAPASAAGGPLYAATPNVRSADGTPLFGSGTATFTSVAPGADGTGGLAAFAGREGVVSLGLFDAPGGLAASINSSDNPYGRRQKRTAYFGSVVYDPFPWLQIGVDGFYSRTVANRGFDVLTADLNLAAASPLNPFGRDVQVSLNETAPLLGENYSEAQIVSYSTVAGVLLKLPDDWRVALDAQYARNVTRYRGLAPADSDRWQQLVDEGKYNPLRDTEGHGPPAEFYDQVLVYDGGRGRFVTLGDYDTLDTALRVTDQSLRLPTGTGTANFGADYRVVRLADYSQQLRYGDGTDAVPPQFWSGRMLQRYSVFGEVQGPVLPVGRLPRWLQGFDADLGLRYVASASTAESNFAPTIGFKLDFNHGWSLRGSFTTANRFPNPQLSRQVSSGPSGGTDLESITDPLRGNDRYNVEVTSPLNPALHTEAAATQTVGVVFRAGREHHWRAALDYVDTRKTDELISLGSQLAVDLESIFPDRVIRGATVPGDPYSAGVITTVFTGDVNAAWRHSQDWNLAVDYAWDQCLGGMLELYGRLVYFQRYEVQWLPTTAPVDELSRPDGLLPGLLRYRSNFGAIWSGPRLGLGLDGHYFHSRTLPLAERAVQGGDQIEPYWQFDAFVQGDLKRWLPWKGGHYGLRGQFRVNNLFGAGFPRYELDPSGAGVQPYGDWRGRTYSISVTATY